MVFTPTNWEDSPSTDTPITAAELNRIEAGIVEADQAASETQAGNVELATAAEMTTGTDLTRAPSVKRVVDHVASALAAQPAASESAAGIVELASAAEMTTGTDLTRAPSVKRVVDHVSAAIAALPSASAASETAAGIVELATATEMTTGTDLTRAPAVKRVFDHVAAAISTLSSSVSTALTGKADKTGSINQFADVADASVSEGQVYIYDSGSGQFSPVDLTSIVAAVGADGRLAVADRPKYYRNLIVVNEGEQPPADASVNDIVLSRPVVGTAITPTLLGSAANNGTDATAASGLVVTLSADAAVGDWLVVPYMQSSETGIVSMTAPTISAGAVSGGFSIPSSSEVTIQTTAQVGYYIGRVTTLIPSGSTITLKPGANRAWMAFAAFKVPGLVTASVVDRVGVGSGNSVTAPANVASAATLTTTQAKEMAFGVIGFNSGNAAPATRSAAAQSGQGWTEGRSFISSVSFGGGTRGFMVIYKELSSAVTVSAPFTISDTAGAPATGQWAASCITLKAV